MERNHSSWVQPRALGYFALRADVLANAVLALEEPWRSRFVDFIAMRADVPLTFRPSQREIALWLEDPNLYRHTRRLLRAWPH